MPVRKVQGGYRWGKAGKVYPTKSQAERQGRAIHASGYQDGGIVDVTQGDDPSAVSRVSNFMGNIRLPSYHEESPPPEKVYPSGIARGAAQIQQQESTESPVTPARLAWFLSQLRPSAGITDLLEMEPGLPSAEAGAGEFMSAEPMPGMTSNIREGRYLDALLQGVGAAGDVAYATAPFTGPLGIAGGAPLKGASALGRAARGTRGGRGIAELEEAKKIDVDTFARDESGFVSPTIQALIEKAPAKLKGQQITEWARKNAKPKELEFLGLDQFVAANPNATTREAVEGISDNRVRVSQNVRSGEGEDLYFRSSTPETLWQHRADDLKYNLEQGDKFTKGEILSAYNWRFPKTEWLKSFDEIPESAIDDTVERLAKQEHSWYPYEMLTPWLPGRDFGKGTFAFGNDDIGYSLFVDGQRVTDPDNIAYSLNEVQIQLQQKLGLDTSFGSTEFKQYVDESLPGGENYREVVFNWDNAPSTHNIGHFDDENQIAHALIRDRTLDDGTPSLHIDELQSDLHTAGSREGYRLPEKLRIEQNNKIEGVLSSGDDLRLSSDGNKSSEGITMPNSGWTGGHPPPRVWISFDNIREIAKSLREGHKPARGRSRTRSSSGLSGTDQIAEELVESLGVEKIYELEDLVKPFVESGPVPDYPFKDDWYEMVLKNLLLDAAREGKPALSVSGSLPIKNRYSDEYSKFYEMLYDKKVPSFMKKLANRYGGEFEQGSLDLVDTYGSRHHTVKTPDFAIDNMQSNIIRITPEMRERILEEGIPSFGGGGIVNVTQGDDPSTVDRVMRFMDRANA